MKSWIKREWPLLLVLGAPFVFIALVWDRIPERMPVHFDAAFRPNGWMHKPWAPLVVPGTSVVAVLIARLFFHFDPKMAKCDADTREHVGRVLRQVMLATAALLSACSIAMLWAAWGNTAPVAATITYGVPLLFLIVGNGLGKLRPNYTVGIRLPWTLESPAVWAKTHRLGGKLLVLLSALLLVMAATGWARASYHWVLLGSLLGWALVVGCCAFVFSRREQLLTPPRPS